MTEAAPPPRNALNPIVKLVLELGPLACSLSPIRGRGFFTDL